MNNSKKSETTVACAGDMDIDKNNMLELKSPIITMSKKEMDKQLDTIMPSTGKYKIVRDPKTGKFVRMEDNRSINEVNNDKYERLMKEAKKQEEQDR